MQNNSNQMLDKTILEFEKLIYTLRYNDVFKNFSDAILQKIKTYKEMPEINAKNSQLENEIKEFHSQFLELKSIICQFKDWTNGSAQESTPLVKRLARNLCDYFSEGFSVLWVNKNHSDIFKHRKQIIIDLYHEMKVAKKYGDTDLASLVSTIVNRNSGREEYPGEALSNVLDPGWWSLLFQKLKQIHIDICSNKIILQSGKKAIEQRDIEIESLLTSNKNLIQTLKVTMEHIKQTPKDAKIIATGILETLAQDDLISGANDNHRNPTLTT